MNSPSNPNYPLAYTEGHTWFYGRKFTVTPDVLIPRPETEVIIDVCKQNLQTFATRAAVEEGLLAPTSSRTAATAPCEDRSARERAPDGKRSEVLILDIGTGSGIIPITLSLELPGAKITATDISKNALKVAQKNAKLHKTLINFINSDLCKNISGIFDVITANLPYVDPSWPWIDHAALAHEPAQALFAKDHGLSLIKRLIREAPPHLTPSGTLILEHDPSQLAELTAYAQKHHFTPISHSPYVTSLTYSAKAPNFTLI